MCFVLSCPEDTTRRRYNFDMTPASSAISDAIAALVEGRGDDPFAVRGRNDATAAGRPALVFRPLQPGVDAVDLLIGSRVWPMHRRQDALFEVILPLETGESATPGYRFR